MRNLLTDVAGVAVGHATDLALGSGVTAVVFDRPATTAVCVLGGAPGGRDTGLLAAEMTVQAVDAVVLSGGSAFGLDAAGGVQAALRELGRGYAVRDVRVPIVPQAIIFDLLNGGDKDWGRFSPYRALGYAAARDAYGQAPVQTASAPAVAASRGDAGGASDRALAGDLALAGDVALGSDFLLGSVGGGTGATTAMVKGGLGSASARTAAGHTVGALVIVNAVGSPLIGSGPWFWAAPFEQGEEFGGLGWPPRIDAGLRLKGGPGIVPAGADAAETFAAGTRGTGAIGTSTTIGLVATDAALTKAQAHRLAIMAHDGLARAVLPAHAPLDGDTMFAAATCTRPVTDVRYELTELGHAATLVMARAIARGVYHACALPVPGAQRSWHERFGA